MKKLSNSLIKLDIDGCYYVSLSFITNLTNLQELHLSLRVTKHFGDFEGLQYSILPQLQILRITCAYPNDELLIKFLENNGKNLKELYLSDRYFRPINNLLKLEIANLCPNLIKFSSKFKENELETFKIILSSCQYLESIDIGCYNGYLSEKEALETLAKYSNKNINELILNYYNPYNYYRLQSELLPEELESFFINWMNRTPQKPISLIIGNSNDWNYKNYKNMKIIKKYIELGVIKKFKVYKSYITE